MQTLVTNKIQLRYKIDSLRNKMILIGLKQGLNHDQTVKLSKKLDEYIIMYQKMN